MPASPLDVTAVVLAGGESRRFGAPKALAPWDGRTMAEQIVASLQTVTPLVLVVTKDRAALGSLARAGVQVVEDGASDFHPLNGLAAGLAAAPTELVFLCACDMPLVDPDLVRALRRLWRGEDAVVPWAMGVPQPLCALYARSCLPAIRALGTGRHVAMKTLLEHVRTRHVGRTGPAMSEARAARFADVDTPADLQRVGSVARLLHSGAMDDELAGLFAFEGDFSESLRCVPMAVRYKLDETGVKIGLRDWNRLEAQDRLELLRASFATGADRERFGARAREVVLARGGTPTALPIDERPAWQRDDQLPADLSARAEAAGLRLSLAWWAALTPLRRFALMKLAHPKHDGTELAKALREFGHPA